MEFVRKDSYVEKILQAEILKEKLGSRIGFIRELAAKDFGNVEAELKVDFIADEDARVTYKSGDKRKRKSGKSLADAYEKLKRYASE